MEDTVSVSYTHNRLVDFAWPSRPGVNAVRHSHRVEKRLLVTSFGGETSGSYTYHSHQQFPHHKEVVL